ncbi:MAG: hypothetical protein R6X34_10980 [Chloroflexota bacterium]
MKRSLSDAKGFLKPSESRQLRGQGITIPSFAEVLTAFPDMRLNVEIKPPDPAVAQAACNLLRQYGLSERALVGTVHDEVIAAFRAACPESPTSMGESEIRPFWILSTLFLGQLYQTPAGAAALQVPERASLPVIGEVQVITPRFVRIIHKHNLEIHAWTTCPFTTLQRGGWASSFAPIPGIPSVMRH